MGRKEIPINSGEIYGELTIIKELPRMESCNKRVFVTKCSCGNDYEAILNNLRLGSITMCGLCKHSENKKV